MDKFTSNPEKNKIKKNKQLTKLLFDNIIIVVIKFVLFV